jgi:hypothetical protein
MRFATWTAFESFMQDTWLVVVNARPVPLAQRVVEPSANLETGMQMKQLSMKEIANAGFDLRGAMGSLLLRQKPWISSNSKQSGPLTKWPLQANWNRPSNLVLLTYPF